MIFSTSLASFGSSTESRKAMFTKKLYILLSSVHLLKLLDVHIFGNIEKLEN